jgi:maltose O-acetyltransferase
MTECEKLDAGLPFDFTDPEVNARKMHAIDGCRELEKCDPKDAAAVAAAVRRLFGGCGKNPSVLPGFICDNGRNIFVGDNFLANYRVTILDIAPVRMGNNVMIGPGSLLTTINHPMDPVGRRGHLGIAKPIVIGDDVWICGNVTIVPGVHIGNNVVVAAGAVVVHDIPDNTLVAGVPAKPVRSLEDNAPERRAKASA